MGKGSRVRDERSQNVNENGSVRLSKRQIIQLQEKKKRKKKLLTWGITAVIAIALVVTIIIGNLPAPVPNLAKYEVAENEFIDVDGAMYAYLVYDSLGQYYQYVVSQYGYDPTVSLLNQNPKTTIEGKTFYKFFCDLAETRLSQYVALASAQLVAVAKDKGVESVTVDEALTEKDVEEIEKYMKSLKEYALDSGAGSINKYLSQAYAPGVNKAAVERYLKIELLATAYVKDYAKSIEDKFINDDEKLTDYRDKNPDSFKKIDYVFYTFTETYAKDATDEQKADAKAKAEAAAKEFKDKYTTVESFKDGIYELEKAKKEASTSTTTTGAKAVVDEAKEKEELIGKFISEGVLYNTTKAEAADTKDYYTWAYSADRVAGDSYVLEVKNTSTSNLSYSYTVYMIEKGVYIDEYNTQTVHHILFEIEEGLKDAALEKAYKEAKEKADKVLEEYNKGDKTLDAFKKLAEEHSDDLGSAEEGGLIKNSLKGTTVEEFDAWIYDEARKEGDVELVKTEYGYHIIYYVGEGPTAWKVTADTALRNEEYQNHLEDLQEKYALEYDLEAKFLALGGKM